jgi:purine-nucleoside phosphorylase
MKSNDVYALAEEAAAAAMVHSRVGKPKLGLVLGSGLGHYAERLAEASSLAYAEIPHFPRTSVAGHAGRLWFGRVGNMPVAVLQGRVHLYEGFTPPEVVFPVRTLAALGVEAVCLTNAAGGVRESFAGGELMRIVDHLNLTGQNPLVGPDDGSRGPRFPDLSQAYDAELGEILDEVAGSQGLDLHAGIYAQLTGPSYETPAEHRARNDRAAASRSEGRRHLVHHEPRRGGVVQASAACRGDRSGGRGWARDRRLD